MGYLSIVGLITMFSTLILVHSQVRWEHICSGDTKEVSCSLGSILEVDGIYQVYRVAGCTNNLTGPVDDVANCSQISGTESNQLKDINRRCNRTNTCNITAFAGLPMSGCSEFSSPLHNIESYSYNCNPGPTTPTVSTVTSITTPKNPSATNPKAVPQTKETPPDYTIPIAAGAGGAALLVIILFIVSFCVWRKRDDQSIENAKPPQESVAYVNMEKTAEGKKSAPRIKEDNWNRPDVAAYTFEADNQINHSAEDPRGLYALPDKSKSTKAKVEEDNPAYKSAESDSAAEKPPRTKKALTPPASTKTITDIYAQPNKTSANNASSSHVTYENQEDVAGNDRSDTESNLAETSFTDDHQLIKTANQANSSDGKENLGFQQDRGQYAEIDNIPTSGQYCEVPPQDTTKSSPNSDRRVRFQAEDDEVIGEDNAENRVPSGLYAQVNKIRDK